MTSARDSEMSWGVQDIATNCLCSPVVFGGILWFVCWIVGSFSRNQGSCCKLIIYVSIIAGTCFVINHSSFELTPNTLRDLQITNTTSKSEALHQLNMFEQKTNSAADPKAAYWIESLRESFDQDYYKKVNLYVLYGEGFDIQDADPVTNDAIDALESSTKPEVFVMYMMLGVFAYIHATCWITPKNCWIFKLLGTVSGLVFMIVLEIIFSESLEEDGDSHLSIFTVLKDIFNQPYAIHPQIKLAMRLTFVSTYVLISFFSQLFYTSVQESFTRSINSYTKTINLQHQLCQSAKINRALDVRDLQRGMQEAQRKLRDSEYLLEQLLREIAIEPESGQLTSSMNIQQPSALALLTFWLVNVVNRIITQPPVR